MTTRTLAKIAPLLIVALGLIALSKVSAPHTQAKVAAVPRTPYKSRIARKKTVLPSTITASGAGTSADDGTYILQPGIDPNGNDYYQLGSNYLYFNGAAWFLGPNLGDGTTLDSDYYCPSGSKDDFPLAGGWITESGSDPPPTFTAPTPDFSLSAELYIPPGLPGGGGFVGGTTTAGITITDLNGFSGNVALSLVSPPSGITGTFDPTPAASSSTLTLNVTAAPGTYTLTVQGVSGALTHTCTFSLTVHANTAAPPTGSPYIIARRGADRTPLPVAASGWAQSPALSDGNSGTTATCAANGSLLVIYGVPADKPVAQVAITAPSQGSADTFYDAYGSTDGVNFQKVAALSGATGATASISGYSLWQFVIYRADGIAPIVSELDLLDSGGNAIPCDLRIYPARTAVNKVFAQIGSRGPQVGAARSASNRLFAEKWEDNSTSRLPIVAQNQLFHQSASRGRTAHGAIKAVNAIFRQFGNNGGPVGNRTVPIVVINRIFTQSATAGSQAKAARVAANLIFRQSARRGPSVHAQVKAINQLFVQLATAGMKTGPLDADAPDPRDPFVVLASELRLLLSLKGDLMSTASNMLAILDALAASYRTNELNAMAARLANLPEMIRGGDGSPGNEIYGFGQDQPILTLLPAAEGMNSRAIPNAVLAGIYSGFMSALSSYCSQIGFASLDAYLTSLNSATRFSALIAPNAALINWLYNRMQPSLLMQPSNVFAPLTTFGTASVGATAGEITYVNMASIPTANVTTGSGQQGYTPAPGCDLVITSNINGTLALTLTGTGMTSAGALVSGRTWTATLDSATAGSTVACTPAVTGDRIASVTSIAGSGAATAGAFAVQSTVERVIS